MTDLHCHILPGMDDGSRNVSTSVDLLDMLKEQGVENVVFTSHFLCEEETIDEYIERRNAAYKKLLNDAPKELIDNFRLKLGAEVYYSEKLVEMDLRPLCITGTDYMLFELPFYNKPDKLDEVIDGITSQGIFPIFAHIERYSYLMSDYKTIYNWVKSGFLMQTNSITIARHDDLSSKMIKLIDNGLIHVIATDTHSINRRPPYMDEALLYVKEKLGEAAAEGLVENGDFVFDGRKLTLNPRCPKLHFWK